VRLRMVVSSGLVAASALSAVLANSSQMPTQVHNAAAKSPEVSMSELQAALNISKPKPIAPLKPLPRGATVKDAHRVLESYAKQSGQTYLVDSSRFAGPAPKAVAAEPDVPTRFSYLNVQTCRELNENSWMDLDQGGVGRIYNHYQWCGWQRLTPYKETIINGRKELVGAVQARVTVLGWGSKSTNEITVRVYVDQVVNPNGSELNSGNTSLRLKPSCEFVAFAGSCSFSDPAPSATILDLANGGVLEYKMTVNLPAESSANPDRLSLLNMSLAFEGTSTAAVGQITQLGTTKPVVRCDAAPQSRGGFTTPACVFGGVMPQWSLSKAEGSSVKEVAAHIYKAINTPNDTLPPYPTPPAPPGNKIIPSTLHRTTDSNLQVAQRDRATYQCRKWISPTPPDESCDEYPFAAVYEGSFNEPENNYSVAFVNGSQNSSEGGQRGNWYLDDRILEGDYFKVVAY
jgi:hypothetical protein